ncbi:hypothetical protein [uncultured Ruegeria sp.]|uniref:hypothetical protein n=1 Tax=uncultured Ruegeria sp. TaxID=259304 RepID=UPI0026126C85|nr:hypothetical protein [uncultured Ruegeria sp.]
MKPLRADLDGKPHRERGPFDKILRDYAACALGKPKIDLAIFQDVIRRICPNGRLASALGEQSLQWHSGLASLCRPEIEGQVGAAAKLHQEHTQRLFLKWREIDYRHESRYDSPPEPGSKRPAPRGTHLCPGLPIPDREFLSEAYLSQVLRPYASAEYECRQIFWRHLQDGHARGHWIGFMPTDAGAYVPMMPGTGFGTGGHYEIDRATYLHRFDKAESELGLENYPHSDPYPGQDIWMFIGAEQLADEMGAARSDKRLRSRSHPRGFSRFDREFVLFGVELFLCRSAASALDAAEKVVDSHGENIKGNSRSAKIERLRKGIAAALKQEGKWAGDEELSKLLQKYPNQSNAP